MRHLTLQTLGVLTLTAAAASPLMAETVSECLKRVTIQCDEALAVSAWWEKPAVGVLCTGMYAACGGTVINIKIL